MIATGTAMTETIDVCICTFRRPSIADTIRSIAAQQLPRHLRLRVIIADNDSSPARREEIEAICRSCNIDHLYVHAPQQNISRARNACLAHASSGWIAFIDDDEIAARDWIVRLIEMRSDRHCVFGVSRARYDQASTSRWMVEGDFHSHSLGPREAAHNGSTCNVLIDRNFVAKHGLQFREELGRIGGEDTMFFHDMRDRGAAFAFAPEAIVHEPVPANRATLGWLLRRRYRSGQIHFLVLRRTGHGRAAIAASALLRVAYCAAGALISPGMRSRAAQLTRGALHAGVLASAFGADLYEEYG